MNDNVLYLEADEDITSAIDKLVKKKASSVSIVVPKRSTLIQSLINLKLLKKAADDNGKELVLVTTDKTATSMAARVGLPVATKLGNEAVLPEAPEAEVDPVADIIEGEEEDSPTAPAMDAAVPAKASAKKPGRAPVVARALDDEPVLPAAAATAKKGLGPRIPDFNSLQKRLLWGAVALLLIILVFGGNYFLTRAAVTIYAKGQQVAAQFSFRVDPAASKSDFAGGVLVGQQLATSHSVTAPVVATGTKDVGTKATGTMTIYNNNPAKPYDFVAGTRFTAPDGKVFRSDQDVHLNPASVVPACCPPTFNTVPSQTQVTVTADQSGDGYNLAPARYTIPGVPASEQSYVYGQGSQMSGGTSKTVKIITQADIDKALSETVARDKEAGQKELEGKVQSGYKLLDASFKQTMTGATADPAVGSQADAGSLTVKIDYAASAVGKSDLEELAKVQELKQVGPENQIYDTGLEGATITLDPKDPARFNVGATASAGAKLNADKIARAIAGQKYGDAIDIASKTPGVEKVEIVLFPGWASSVPSIKSNIKVSIKVAGQ